MADVLTGGALRLDGLEDLTPSDRAKGLLPVVRRFIAERVEPAESELRRLGVDNHDRWSFAPGQLELLESLKSEARSSGLWNLFLPSGAAGLSTLDYAYVAFELGRCPLASEVMNCSPPDTGNMEVLERVGTEMQRRRWLAPLLDGSVRSAFAMTEPDVASSDVRNISCASLQDGNDWVIDGEKFFVSGAADPRCAFIIVLARSSSASTKQSHTMFIVPIDAPGLEIAEAMCVFGADSAPTGHMLVRFRSVRVSDSHVLLGEGQGLEISQLRLGAGRIHGCMRAIGAAERALSLMVERGMTRQAFRDRLVSLGKNTELISRARIDIEAMRLMVLRAAKAMDVLDTADARIWVSAAKAMVPERVCRIIDEAIQLHGAAGLSQWTPLADAYVQQRAFRIGDGPDEVHHMVVGRAEIRRHAQLINESTESRG